MSDYGARPVLSALLPQLTLRYNTRPSRGQRLLFRSEVDSLRSFGLRPVFSVFKWRVSLDFLTALVDDPERGSAYYEAQSQLELLATEPLTNTNELESDIGLFEDWSDVFPPLKPSDWR